MTDPRIQHVLDYIDVHFAEALTLARLAGVACLSSFHFSRLFAAEVGHPPLRHLLETRLAHARHLLATTALPVTGVAAAAGFRSLSNFNAQFRQRHGLTPGAFRLREKRKKQEETRNKRVATAAACPDNPPVSSFFKRIVEMNIQEIRLQDMEVAYLRQQGSYLDTGPLWQRFMAWTCAHGLPPPAHQYFGISYDEPDLPDDAKTCEVCVILPAGFSPPDDAVLYKTVPGGLFLRYRFYDTADRFAFVYKQVVTDYLPHSVYGLDRARNFLEFVMNDPYSDPEGKVRIDLYIPVGKREDGS